MKVYNQVLSNLKEDKEEWYDACNDAEQAVLKLKNMCSNEEAIKSLERIIIDLNNIRMEQYKALKEYSLVEEELSKANIYQIKDIRNCDYAFEDYNDAKDKINMDDYAEVASIAVPKNEDALENIFMLGNTAKHEFTVYGPFRSISVSDIVELDGKKYYVDTFGFKELNTVVNESVEELPKLKYPYSLSIGKNGKYYISSSHPYDLSDYSFAVSDSLDGEYSIYKPNPNYSVYMDISKRPQQNLYVTKTTGYENALSIMEDIDSEIEPHIDRT